MNKMSAVQQLAGVRRAGTWRKLCKFRTSRAWQARFGRMARVSAQAVGRVALLLHKLVLDGTLIL